MSGYIDSYDEIRHFMVERIYMDYTSSTSKEKVYFEYKNWSGGTGMSRTEFDHEVTMLINSLHDAEVKRTWDKGQIQYVRKARADSAYWPNIRVRDGFESSKSIIPPFNVEDTNGN